MVTTEIQHAQGLLFSEPAWSETGVWCELAEGIDPAEWAYLCRYLGSLTPGQFKAARKKLFANPDSLANRFKRLFSFQDHQVEGVPPVCLGPEGLPRQAY